MLTQKAYGTTWTILPVFLISLIDGPAGYWGNVLPEGFLYDRTLGKTGGIRQDVSTTEWETTLLDSEEVVGNVESSGSKSRSEL